MLYCLSNIMLYHKLTRNTDAFALILLTPNSPQSQWFPWYLEKTTSLAHSQHEPVCQRDQLKKILKAFNLVNSAVFLFLLTQAGLCYIKPVLYHCSIRFIKRLHYLAATQRTLRDIVSATSDPPLPSPPQTLTWHPWLHGDISHVSGLALPHYCHLVAKKMRDAALIIAQRPQYTQSKVLFRYLIRGKMKFDITEQSYTVSKHPNTAHSAGSRLQLYRIKHEKSVSF